MEELFLRFFESTITTSVIALALILLSPKLNKIYTATWKNGAWLILALRLIIPFSFNFIAPICVPIPDMQLAIPQTSQTIQTLQDAQTTSILMQQFNALHLTVIMAKIRGVGVIAFLLHQIISYYLYKRQIKRWGFPASTEQIIKTLDKVSDELGIGNKVKILISKKADSPMMIGFVQPMLLLPYENYTESELFLIIKHELVHYKRHDIWYKAILLLANAIHWYNPLIYIMFKEANKDLEFSCDEAVTNGTSLEVHKQYVEIILSSVHKQSKYQTVLTTYFYGGYRMIKERLQNILSVRIKRRGILSFLFLTMTIIIIGGLVACGAQSSSNDAIDVVTKHLEAKRDNNYDMWESTLWTEGDTKDNYTIEKEGDLGVISLTIERVEISEKESANLKKQYIQSDLAKSLNWSNQYIEDNMIAILAKYTVDYDNTKVPYNEGEIIQYFYLLRKDKYSPWLIWEQSYDVTEQNIK